MISFSRGGRIKPDPIPESFNGDTAILACRIIAFGREAFSLPRIEETEAELNEAE